MTLLPPMPSELILVAKDRLIGQAILKWGNAIKEKLEAQAKVIAAAQEWAGYMKHKPAWHETEIRLFEALQSTGTEPKAISTGSAVE